MRGPARDWHGPCNDAGVRILVYQNPNAGHEPRPAADVIGELQRAGHEAQWLNAKDHTLGNDDLRGVDLVVAQAATATWGARRGS